MSDFNSIEADDAAYPKVGLVGEIFVKYNPFSNNDVAQWLMDQGLEVVMPPLTEFFTRTLVDSPMRVETNLQRRDLMWAVTRMGTKPLHRYLDQVQDTMSAYRRFHRHTDIEAIADGAEGILSLNHQYGESWLIAGEVVDFMGRGVNNVLCLQPFGCIANHVIAKRAEKKMKQTYPQLNILFLDADAGVSEVNFFNRLHFFVDHAKKAGTPANTEPTIVGPGRFSETSVQIDEILSPPGS